MNKKELIRCVSKKTQLSQTNAEAVVEAVFNTISNEISKGNTVQISGFGSFEVRERAAREGFNLRTKEKITIAASKKPVFKPSKVLKNMINE